MKKAFIYLLLIVFFVNCKGTIDTICFKPKPFSDIKTACIYTTKYIRYRGVDISLFSKLGENPSDKEKVEKLDKTATIIKNELEKRGINVAISDNSESKTDFDMIVIYDETYFWDFKNVLGHMEIAFITPDKTKLIAISNFDQKNRETHNFPSAEKIVPKMIEEMLEQ